MRAAMTSHETEGRVIVIAGANDVGPGPAAAP